MCDNVCDQEEAVPVTLQIEGKAVVLPFAGEWKELGN